MRKLVLFVLISSTIIMSGQECKPDKYETIEINFNDKSIRKLPNKIKTGKFYKIKINDINPNIYSVLIGTKDTVLSRPELKVPSFGDFNLDALSSLTSGFKINTDQLNIDSLSQNLKIFSQVATLKNKSLNNETKIQKLINDFENEVGSKANLLEKTKENFDSQKMEFYTYRIEMMKLKPEPEIYDFKKAQVAFSNIRSSLVLQQQNLNISLKIYQEFLEDKNVKDFLSNNDVYKEKSETIQTTYKTINSKIDEFQQVVSADVVEKLLKSILNLKHINNFESFPIQFRSEQAEVSIQFVPKDSTMGLQTEKIQPFSFPQKSLEYWSVGSSFYYAFNLRNERFSSIASLDANNNKIYNVIQEDNNNNEFGMAATIRYGNQFHENFGTHISFGPGVSIGKNISPRLLLGGGFSFGSKHSLAVDFGCIAGYVERKSNSLDLTQSYSEIPQTTLTKIDYGYFISLGYLYKF